MSYISGPGAQTTRSIVSSSGVPEQQPVQIQQVSGTGNLLNFYDIAGNLLSYVDNTGAFGGAALGAAVILAPTSSTRNVITPTGATTIPLTINTASASVISTLFTPVTNAGSGLNGWHIRRVSGSGLPIGISLDEMVAGVQTPRWDFGLDATTDDFALLSSALATDVMRFRSDTGQVSFGRAVGQPSASGPQLGVFAGGLATPQNGISVTQGDETKYGLQLLTSAVTNIRTKIVFQAQATTGFQMGTDSTSSNVNDFWISNNATGGFPLTVSAGDVITFGTGATNSQVVVNSNLGLLVQPATDNVAFNVKAVSGQTADLVNVRENNNTLVFGVGPDGTITNTVNSSATATERNVQQNSHNSTGTPAAGFGLFTRDRLETTTTTFTTAAERRVSWVDATHASRKARVRHTVFDTAEREGLRIEASGSAPMIGFLGAAAVVRQTNGTAADLAAVTDAAAKAFLTALSNGLVNLGLFASPA